MLIRDRLARAVDAADVGAGVVVLAQEDDALRLGALDHLGRPDRGQALAEGAGGLAGRDVVGPAHADHRLGARHHLERAERVGLEVEELGEDVLVAQALAGSERDRLGLDGLGVVLAAGQPLEVNLGLLRPGVVDLDVGLEERALGAGRHRRRRDEGLAAVRDRLLRHIR